MEEIHVAPDASFIRLSNSNPERALKLRDALFYHVHTLAIHIVDVYENDSETQSEILVHRLGLVPITFLDGRRVLGAFNRRGECWCQSAGCPRCVTTFELSVDAPATVYSHDLKSRNPLVRALPNFPLATLVSGRVRLIAQAQIGSGTTKHAATCPPPFFTSPHIVSLKPERLLTPHQIQDFVDACPTRVFDIEDGRVVVSNTSACHGCRECVRKSRDFRDSTNDINFVSIRVDTTQFHFPIESVGQLLPSEIVAEALEAFRHKS